MVVLHDLIHSSRVHQDFVEELKYLLLIASRGAHSFKSSSRFLLAEFKYLFFSRLEVQIILRFLLKWSFAFLHSSQLFRH